MRERKPDRYEAKVYWEHPEDAAITEWLESITDDLGLSESEAIRFALRQQAQAHQATPTDSDHQ